MIGKSFQFILKPALDCNLACKYCYAAQMQKDKDRRMSLQDAFAAVDWALKFCDYYGIQKVSILWQGGEPLLCGAEFIEKVAQYYEEGFKSRGVTCSSIIQTNLLLMNKRFSRVIKRHFEGAVGFSYDYKSNTRCFRNGSNSETAILRKIREVQGYGLKLYAICQITKTNINSVDKLYSHFKGLGIDFKISQIFPTQYKDQANLVIVDSEDAASAICRLFDIWITDRFPTIDIINLKELVESLIRGFSTECSRKEDCAGLLVSLLPSGRILPCARFDKNTDVIGNYYTNHPADVMRRKGNMCSGVEDVSCRNCKFRCICYGGCCYNRVTGWHENECKANKIIFTHVANRLAERGVTTALKMEQL